MLDAKKLSKKLVGVIFKPKKNEAKEVDPKVSLTIKEGYGFYKNKLKNFDWDAYMKEDDIVLCEK